MKATKFTEAQIAFVLKQAEDGVDGQSQAGLSPLQGVGPAIAEQGPQAAGQGEAARGPLSGNT